MGSPLGSPAGRLSLVMLPSATLAHWLVLLREEALFSVIQEFMAGFGESHLGGC